MHHRCLDGSDSGKLATGFRGAEFDLEVSCPAIEKLREPAIISLA